jgi:hypothetical protein
MLFIKFWKRQSNYLGLMWDTLHQTADDAVTRAEWRPTNVRKSPITRKDELYVPYFWRIARHFISDIGIFFCFMVMCSTIFGLVILQAYFRQMFQERNSVNDVLSNFLTEINFQISGLSTSVAIAAFTVTQIILLRPLYRYVSKQLNNWENHKTWSRYENSYIFKSMIFSCVNNYGFLVYLAVLKPIIYSVDPLFKILGVWVDGCSISNGQNQCTSDVVINVISVFTFRQITKQVGSILEPILKRKRKAIFKKSSISKRKYKPVYIQDGGLDRFTHHDLTLQYTNAMIQFGFIIMFSSLNPLGPLIAWLSIRTQSKIDMWDGLVNLQRPFGKSVHSIGPWESILRFMVHLGIWTNAICIAFISNGFNSFLGSFSDDSSKLIILNTHVSPMLARVLFVFLYQQIASILLMIIDSIPNHPKVVRTGLKSEAYFELQQPGFKLDASVTYSSSI